MAELKIVEEPQNTQETNNPNLRPKVKIKGMHEFQEKMRRIKKRHNN